MGVGCDRHILRGVLVCVWMCIDFNASLRTALFIRQLYAVAAA